jgi:hypothetical protein
MSLKRRQFITLLGGAATWPITAPGQQPQQMRRVGFVGMQPREAPHYTNFLRRMAELGYQEGRNLPSITFKHRMSMAMTKAIKNSPRASPMCSSRWETSRRYVRRFPRQTVSRSRSWPWILILL